MLPFLGLVYVSVINISTPLQLTILTWQTRPLPIGIWILISSSSAALITSTTATALTFQKYHLKRTVIRKATDQEEGKFQEISDQEFINDTFDPASVPERNLQDPSPTISVPYRVINKTSNHNNFINRQEYYDSEPEINNDQESNISIKETTEDADWLEMNQENW